MKKPEYTAGVVSIYRKYLDLYLLNGKKQYQVKKEDKQKLMDLFNRNGFNQGYYFTQNSRDMITLKESTFRQRNERYIQEIQTTYINQEKKEKINGEFIIFKDLSATLTVWKGENRVTIQGQEPQEAQNAPITREDIEKRLRKTKETPFEFDKIDIQLGSDLFLPVGVINQMRREALAQLEEVICAKYRRKTRDIKLPDLVKHSKKEREAKQYKFTVLVRTIEQLEAVLEKKMEHLEYLYLDSNFVLNQGQYQKILHLIQESQIKCKFFLALPHIYRQQAKQIFESKFSMLEQDFDGYLVRNLEELEFLSSHSKKEIATDYNLYLFNKRSSYFLKEHAPAISMQCLPVELNAAELRKQEGEGKELLVYGKIPLMITAGCLNKTLQSCNHKNDQFYLEDRYHVRFQVDCICKYCYNIIYNSKPISLLTCRKQMDSLEIEFLRIEFTEEKKQEVKKLIGKFTDQYIYNKKTEEISEFTRGHFKRGVE